MNETEEPEEIEISLLSILGGVVVVLLILAIPTLVSMALIMAVGK